MDSFEEMVDRVFRRVFPPVSTAACIVAAVYFGGHVIVAVWMGWI